MLEDDILRNENIKNSEKRMRELGEKNYFESFNNVYKIFTSNTNKF